MHNEVYGTHASGEVPDIVNVRVMSLAEVAKLDLPELPPQKGVPKEVARRKVLFEEAEGYIDTPIFDRATLGARAEITGPAVIEQLDSTTVIMPGQTARVERYGNIIIDIGAGS
jgi:N-methylhydantoinase A